MTVQELINELSDIVATYPYRASQRVYMVVPVSDGEGDFCAAAHDIDGLRLDGTSVDLEASA